MSYPMYKIGQVSKLSAIVSSSFSIRLSSFLPRVLNLCLVFQAGEEKQPRLSRLPLKAEPSHSSTDAVSLFFKCYCHC